MLVWWATEIECVSALARRERERELEVDAVQDALSRLDELKAFWNEIEPTEIVRHNARRLLRVHNLRGADSLQLGAALVASEGRPETLEILTLDTRLADAAQREGFSIPSIAEPGP
jgi:predicted nucleic acid-binding protein